jgi:glutamate-1-semialdehyde 2,1-aminomutase
MERMRFVSTGTEAVMSAIRVARAFTKRSLVLKFAGNYHGHTDLALFDAGASAHTSDPSASGIPDGVMRDVAVARYNDLADVDAFLGGRERELAAIVVEPIVGNMGYVAPAPGFLEGLRERTKRYGAVLIFDEVITWLRFGLRGAQGRVGVEPDMTTIGKIMGGGVPIAAFGGREHIMRVLAPTGSTFTGGTHGGNPFSVGMAHRVLDLLEANPQYYEHLRALAARLAAGIRAVFNDRALPYAVVQTDSIVDFKFRPGAPNRNYDDARRADKDAYARYWHGMLEAGILLPPSQNEVMFVSVQHTDADIDETIAALAHAVDA